MITTPRSNLEIKVKSTKPQGYEARKKGNKHTKDCWPSSVQLDLIWGRDWSIPSTIKEFLQRDTNELQEISTRAHKEQNLISTHFPNLKNEQDTQWFHSPKVFTMFPNLREPHYKDPQP